jgi:hypothetical protein
LHVYDIKLFLDIHNIGCKITSAQFEGASSGARFWGSTMAKLARAAFGILLCLGLSAGSATAATKKLTHAQIAACIKNFHIDVNGSDAKSGWHKPAEGAAKCKNETVISSLIRHVRPAR